MAYDPNKHAMVIRADARAMGAVTALSTTNRRKPRTNRALSGVVSYNPSNGITRADAVEFVPKGRTRTNVKRQTRATLARIDKTRELLMSLPTIHDGSNN